MAMNLINKFRFWCQKVLPLVYDDSLSYYEVLCKVVAKLNEVITNINEIPDYINQYIDERLSDEHIQELIRQAIYYLEDAISKDNEGNNTNFSKNYNAGDLLWWNDKFYRVVRDVDAGDTILDSGTNPNIEEISFAEMFNEFMAYIKELFTENDEGGNTNASRDFIAGEFVWINDHLYETTKAIMQGNSFIYTGDNKNVESINIDGLIHSIRLSIATILSAIGDLDELNTSDKSNLVNAINSLVTNIGDLNELTTDDKTNLVSAINEVNSTGGGALAMIGDMEDLETTAKDTLVNSINEVYGDLNTEIDNRTNGDTNLQNQINQLTGGTWEHYTQLDGFTNANATDFPTFVGDCYINKDLSLMNVSFIANTGVATGKALNGNTIVANMPFKMTPNQTIGVYEACMMNMYRVSDGEIYFAHTGALFISDSNGDVKMQVILEDYGLAGINVIALMGQITIPITDWGIVGTNTTGVWEHYTQLSGIENADPTKFPTMVADCYINRRLGLMSLSFICNTMETYGVAIDGNQNLFTLPFTLKEGIYGYYEACILDMYNTVSQQNYWAHTGMVINVNALGQPTVQSIMESFGTNGLNTCAVVGNIVIPCIELLPE